MAVEFRSIGADDYQVTGSTVSPGAPSGVVVGDLLLLSVAVRGGTADYPTTPTGWNFVQTDAYWFAGGRHHLYWRNADGTAADTPTVTKPAGIVDSMRAVIARFDGHNIDSPIDSTAYLEDSSEPITHPSVTSSNNGSLAVALGFSYQEDTGSYTFSNSFVERLGTTSGECMWLATKPVDSGATGVIDVTNSTTLIRCGALTLVIAPAPPPYIIGTGGDFASFAAAEAALTLPYSGGTTYIVTGTVVGNHTFSALSYSKLTLVAQTGEEATATGSGAFIDGDIVFGDVELTIDKLVISSFTLQNISTVEAQITNAFIGKNSASGEDGITFGGGTKAYVHNCIIANANDDGLYSATTNVATMRVDQCTIVGALRYGAMRCKLTNTFVFGSVSNADFLQVATGSDYLASEDATATTTVSYTGRTSADFVDYAGGNYDVTGFLLTAGSGGGSIGAVLTPAVIGDTLHPALVSETLSILSPSIQAGAVTISPALTALALVVNQVTLPSGLTTISPALLSLTAAVNNLSIQPGTVTISPELLSLSLLVTNPSLSSIALLSPALTSLTVSVPDIAVSLLYTINPSLLSLVSSVNNPEIPYEQFVRPVLTSLTLSTYLPALLTGDIIETAIAQLSLLVSNPSIQSGSVVISPSLTSLTVEAMNPRLFDPALMNEYFYFNQSAIEFFKQQTGLDSNQFNELAKAYYKQVAGSDDQAFNELLADAQKVAGFKGLSPTDWRNF